jgi:CdiI N-terminal domain
MTFNIHATESLDLLKTVAEISLGDHHESFPLITTRWSRQTYESQWVEALTALVEGRVQSCVLITDIQPPKQSSGVAYWALFREADLVYFQERFSRDMEAQLTGAAIHAEKHIPLRKQGTPVEQKQVSEWVVQLFHLRQFVKRGSKNAE